MEHLLCVSCARHEWDTERRCQDCALKEPMSFRAWGGQDTSETGDPGSPEAAGGGVDVKIPPDGESQEK